MDRYKLDRLVFSQPYPYQHPEDEDRDGLQNAGFFINQPLDPTDSSRELHYTQLLGKQQTLPMGCDCNTAKILMMIINQFLGGFRKI